MTIQKIEANSPLAKSADLTAENIAKLKAMFPELVTETRSGGQATAALNMDVLKALIGDATATDSEEKYGLNWHGKRQARQVALTPSTGTLRPCPDESVDWDTTQNLMIEGDNLEVLKLLQKSYAGKVKMIYIDPPYNTGKDFVYPDNFQDNIKNYLELTGQTEGGAKISSNTDASGRFHTDWLNMIYPRLKLAHKLLTQDGVILISIDDSEQASLRKCLDEIFGEENFIEQFIWKKSYGGGAKERFAVTQHEYCLMYARNIECLDPLWLSPDPEAEERYYDGRDEHFETKGPYRLKPLEATKSMDRRENLIYPVCAPDGTSILPKRQWWWSRARTEKVQAEGGLHFFKKGDEWSVSYKQYLIGEDGEKRGAKPFSIFDGPYTQHGTAEIRAMFEDKVVFSYPKPTKLLTKLLEFGSDKNSIVMDFFAGSGSLGDAVMNQNAQDGGNRRFVLVQLPEPLNSESREQSVAAAYCDSIQKPHRITELTKERLRRAGKKVAAETPAFKGDIGFRVFKLDTSNIRAWNPNPADLKGSLFANLVHIEPGRSNDDVLYEVLLKLGLDLCVPMEQKQIVGKSVHSIGGGTLLACLDEHIGVADAESLALGMAQWRAEQGTATETTAVFRDSAFENDVAKSNLAAILEQHGIKHVRSL